MAAVIVAMALVAAGYLVGQAERNGQNTELGGVGRHLHQLRRLDHAGRPRHR